MASTDEVIVVAIDIDQNEDAAAVKDHIARNDFKGIFAISPPALTGALTDAYGVGVITPPRSPKILVNAAQTSAEYFENVRSAEELRTLADAAR
ncbi:MAG: hypothetical protein Q7U89_01735 [Coriobacteriia bacterium]|nr:hypothetical protein [Coriobacteriia bacterium]